MASNSTDPPNHTQEDDEYQLQDEDEEDDEQTIEEEEQLGSEDEENELDDLEAGANMPLEELLKLYGQNNGTAVNTISQTNDESSTNDDDEEDVEVERQRQRQHQHQHQHRLHHLLQVNGSLLPEDDDDESDDSFEPEIIKTINVGDDYQAEVPSNPQFDPIKGPFDEREMPHDELLWSLSAIENLDNDQIDEYLKTIRSEFPYADDEISLQVLLNSQMNIDLAVEKFRQLPVKTIYSYREWSNEEIQQFEEGLREYGKNFFKVTVFKCSNRTVREVIHFYYQWKKTERFQLFMEEQQRMNAITSVTDMIEKFIEQQEQQFCTAVGVINSTDSTTDLKVNTTVSFVQTSKRTYDQVEHDSEPSTTKKPALNNSSPTSIT